MDARDVVFVDVDTQRDFCLADGALAVKDAPVEAFRRLTALAVKKKIPIVGSVDSHPFDDPEFETFPPHCVKGTEGQLKVEGTLPERSRFVAIHEGATPALADLRCGAAQAAYLEKQTFSIFSHPEATDLLLALSRDIAVVYGVATDYCIKAAVLGLRERAYEVYVVTDAIAGVAPDTDAEARDEMVRAGAVFITEKELSQALNKAA